MYNSFITQFLHLVIYLLIEFICGLTSESMLDITNLKKPSSKDLKSQAGFKTVTTTQPSITTSSPRTLDENYKCPVGGTYCIFFSYTNKCLPTLASQPIFLKPSLPNACKHNTSYVLEHFVARSGEKTH